MKRPAAFTLTEILVVIATIALLMTILLPVLRRSRQEAEAAICISNIRQLLLGMLSYENEKQTLPCGFYVESEDNGMPIQPPGGFPGYSPPDLQGWWWFNYIEDFYKKSDKKTAVVNCPSKRLSDRKLKLSILSGNYGVNISICKSSFVILAHGDEFTGTPLHSTNIQRPGETMLIIDSGYAVITWWHATDEPPVVLGNTLIEDASYIPGLWINKDRILWPGTEIDAIDGRHTNKTVNVGFVDGHAHRMKADDLFVEKTSNDYRNRSPLWVPK
jgi:prepilin-type processing-associated H-X9-DG protein